MSEEDNTPLNRTDDIDLEKLLERKNELEKLIERKFKRVITVMFTDLSGSTRLAEELGDLTMRSLLKRHNDIVLPIIENNAGVVVKTMGDGTMSYFEDPNDAIRATIEIQHGMKQFNDDSTHPELLIRCGLNTGKAIVEKGDVNGDAVNVAQRFEAMASARDILISEDTYKPVKDNPEFSIMFLKEETIKGKIGPQRVYKVLWCEEDIRKFKDGDLHAETAEEEFDYQSAATSDISLDEIRGETEAKLTVRRKGAEAIAFDIGSGQQIIGRSSKADIVVPEQFVSRQHGRIFKEGVDFYIEDLESHVGIQFKGSRVTKKKLNDGDVLSIGSVSLTFNITKRTPKKEDRFYADADETLTFDPGSILRLVLKEQNRDIAKYELTPKKLIIGRQEGCDIRLQSPMVSRKHAEVYAKNHKACIKDLGSNNGTYIDGKRVTEDTCAPGQRITIGPFAIEVQDPLAPGASAPSVPNSTLDATADESGSNISQKMFNYLKNKGRDA